MAVLGSMLTFIFGLVFVAVAALVLWGSWLMLRQEVLRGFVSVPASLMGRWLTVVGLALPLLGATLLALLAAWRFFEIALGLG